jgi:hypothetical protein
MEGAADRQMSDLPSICQEPIVVLSEAGAWQWQWRRCGELDLYDVVARWSHKHR